MRVLQDANTDLLRASLPASPPGRGAAAELAASLRGAAAALAALGGAAPDAGRGPGTPPCWAAAAAAALAAAAEADTPDSAAEHAGALAAGSGEGTEQASAERGPNEILSPEESLHGAAGSQQAGGPLGEGAPGEVLVCPPPGWAPSPAAAHDAAARASPRSPHSGGLPGRGSAEGAPATPVTAVARAGGAASTPAPSAAMQSPLAAPGAREGEATQSGATLGGLPGTAGGANSDSSRPPSVSGSPLVGSPVSKAWALAASPVRLSPALAASLASGGAKSRWALAGCDSAGQEAAGETLFRTPPRAPPGSKGGPHASAGTEKAGAAAAAGRKDKENVPVVEEPGS